MAYGITNKAKFRDDNGIYYEIHILKDGYVGSDSEFNVGGDGFKLSWKGRGANIDSPIHSSEITFDFILRDNDDRNRVLNMYQEKEGAYIARIYKNNSGVELDFEAISPVGRFWTGVIILNESILEDIDYPQPFRIRAIDGLELLKSKKFNEITNVYNELTGETDATIKTADTNGDFEGGYYTFQSLILGILNQNPITEVFTNNPLTDALYAFFGNWWSDLTNISQSDGYYDATRIIIVASNAFYTKPSTAGATIKYLSCYDALEQILFYMNARIHQEDGRFAIVQLSVNGIWQDNNSANYVVYSTGGTAVSFSINQKKTLSSQDNKRSLTKFNFKRILKRLVYNITGASDATPLNVAEFGGGVGIINSINLPGTSQQTAWHTFTEYQLPSLETPSAGAFKNTYLQVEAGQNMTFIFNYSVRHLASAPLDASEWEDFNDFAFRAFIIIKIKTDATDYYLRFDTDQEKYVWSTNLGPVFPAPNYALAVINQNVYTTDTVGDSSLDNMEAVPVDGQLQYYVYKDYSAVYSYNIDADGNYVPSGTFIDYTSELDVDVDSFGSPDYSPGNYGPAFDFPVASCQIYLDGESPSFVGYEYENLDGGTVIDNGVEMTETLNFIEQYATMGGTATNFIYIKDSDTFGINNLLRGQTASWKYIDDAAMSAVHLPDLKGMTNLGLLSKFRFIMDTRIVRETDELTNSPYKFIYLMEETIEGSTRYLICSGGEYIARPAFFRGEWIEVDFNDLDKSGNTHTGTYIDTSHSSFSTSGSSMLPNNPLPKIK
jgi:hypothetical protein